MAISSSPKFGEEALALGFVRTRDVRKALQIQTYRRARGLPVPLLGEALRELGCMTDEQICDTFNSLCQKSQAAKDGPRSWWQRLLNRSA